MKLTRWDTKETIHESEHDTIKECVEDSIRKDVSLYRIDLRDADLGSAYLGSAVLIGADLRDANLRDADLRRADLRDAVLRDANLRRADLRRADLRRANMAGAKLRGADLRDANFRGANMRYANLDFSSWPLGCGSCGVKLDKENNERFVYHAMINMDKEVLAEFLKNPVEFANRFAERKDIDKIKAGEK